MPNSTFDLHAGRREDYRRWLSELRIYITVIQVPSALLSWRIFKNAAIHSLYHWLLARFSTL